MLTSMYTEVHSRLTHWDQATTTLLGQLQKSSSDDIPVVVQEGYRLRRDILPYAEAVIPQAVQDQKTLDERIDLLERTREWLYNQQTLNLISGLKDMQGKDSKELPPIDKLKRLAAFDERHLSPYVSQRYQEEWNKLFAELKDDQKIEATKLRIMREVTP